MIFQKIPILYQGVYTFWQSPISFACFSSNLASSKAISAVTSFFFFLSPFGTLCLRDWILATKKLAINCGYIGYMKTRSFRATHLGRHSGIVKPVFVVNHSTLVCQNDILCILLSNSRILHCPFMSRLKYRRVNFVYILWQADKLVIDNTLQCDKQTVLSRVFLPARKCKQEFEFTCLVGTV